MKGDCGNLKRHVISHIATTKMIKQTTITNKPMLEIRWNLIKYWIHLKRKQEKSKYGEKDVTNRIKIATGLT